MAGSLAGLMVNLVYERRLDRGILWRVKGSEVILKK